MPDEGEGVDEGMEEVDGDVDESAAGDFQFGLGGAHAAALAADEDRAAQRPAGTWLFG